MKRVWRYKKKLDIRYYKYIYLKKNLKTYGPTNELFVHHDKRLQILIYKR